MPLVPVWSPLPDPLTTISAVVAAAMGIICTTDGPDAQTWINMHHAHRFLLCCLTMEASTPFVQARWFIIQHVGKDSTTHVVNNLCMMLAFFGTHRMYTSVLHAPTSFPERWVHASSDLLLIITQSSRRFTVSLVPPPQLAGSSPSCSTTYRPSTPPPHTPTRRSRPWSGQPPRV